MSGRIRRMVVMGREGQVARSLAERGAASGHFEVVTLGRPLLDLAVPEGLEAVLAESRPDVIVSAAAYTAVDQAENEAALATTVNGVAPGRIAAAAASFSVPVIHLSTDYVFDGGKDGPYREDDPVTPLGVYGRTKLAGERAVAGATENHVILRTAWVYSPFGRNFARTMLRLAESRESINVVADQIGNPTAALDVADGIMAVAENLLGSDAPALRGTFHMTGTGEASWADFAEEIFARSAALGGPSAAVERIPASAYPTPARRPANSRLDCAKLADIHGVRLRDWKAAAAETVARLVRAGA